jgi:uncharacterized C2H2 Zn-finger protein
MMQEETYNEGVYSASTTQARYDAKYSTSSLLENVTFSYSSEAARASSVICPPSPSITPKLQPLLHELPIFHNSLADTMDCFFGTAPYTELPSNWPPLLYSAPTQSVSALEFLYTVSVDLDNHGIPVCTGDAVAAKSKNVQARRRSRGADSGYYQCLECDAVFTSKKNLTSHSVRHTGKMHPILTLLDGKPFQCGICSDSLKRKGDLLRHVRIVHGRQTKLPCTVCKTHTATDLEGLNLHLTTEHVGDPAAIEISRLIMQAVGFKPAGERKPSYR